MFKNRWYQDECEAAIYRYFEQGGTGNPVCALPTGTGKSVIIGNFVKGVMRTWPNQRIMMLTHVKELIQQNAEKLLSVWPTAPIGVHSAGLKSRDTIQPIIFGGVQSVAPTIVKSMEQEAHKPEHLRHFGHRDLLIVDECHLMSDKDNSHYQFIVKELKRINPYLKVIGFTATPYRLKMGLITDNGIFTDICYDITGVDAFNRLIDEGYLALLVPRPTNAVIDVSNVGMSNGDFNTKQLGEEADKVLYDAVKETCEYGYNRKAWLMFNSSVDNAEKAAAMLQSFGVEAAAVHSKLPAAENDRRIQAFKHGEFTALCNNNKLTTGFDYPEIDLISMLRPTMSPGLWVQMLGRGTRPAEGKSDCLVLDFAGNTPRLGPINDPVLPKKPGQGGGDAPVRICDCCGNYNHASVRHCIFCGAEFSFKTKLLNQSGTDQLVKSTAPEIDYFDVTKVFYNLHEKKKNGVLIAPPSIRVTYVCGLQSFTEWVCLEHGGLPAKTARDWWRLRHAEEPPPTTFQALQKVADLRQPRRIKVWVNKKYPEILSVEW